MHYRPLIHYAVIQTLFCGGSDGKESACHLGDPGLIPGSGISFGEGNGNPVQCSCLENPMDGGAWRATVHGGHKESDRNERLILSLFIPCVKWISDVQMGYASYLRIQWNKAIEAGRGMLRSKISFFFFFFFVYKLLYFLNNKWRGKGPQNRQKQPQSNLKKM